MRLLVTTPYLRGDAMSVLRGAADEIEVLPFPNTDEAVAEAIAGFDPDGILSRTFRIGAAEMDAAPALKVISKHGVGVDNIDIEAARARGIMVTNCFGVNAPAVAEHTVMMMLAVAKNMAFHDRRMQAGAWSRFERNSTTLEGRSLGLIGFGEVARHVSRMAQGFGMPILAYGPRLMPATLPKGVRAVGLPELLETAGIVSLHCPLTDETRHMIDAQAMAAMRQDAWLLNTSRGGLIDEPALTRALDEGSIAAAGLDCFETEPVDPANPLLHMDNVAVTPHCAGSGDDTRARVGLTAARHLVAALSGGEIDPRAVIVEAGSRG